MKQCLKCGTLKELDEFYIRRYPNGKEARQHRCKQCQKVWTQPATKAWRVAKPEDSRKSNKKTKLKLKYGLTPEAVHNLLEEQKGKCRICECPIWFGAPEKANVPHIDHCHMTGNVRGLLCLTCNTGIGMFGDSPELLSKAIKYLLDHNHRERLSELAPEMGDAIVRSYENENRKRSTEMIDPAAKQ